MGAATRPKRHELLVIGAVVLGALLFVSCGGEPPAVAEEQVGAEELGVSASETTGSADREIEERASEREAAEGPEPLGRCHVSCCSDRVLELQAQSDDPSIQNECCFCDD